MDPREFVVFCLFGATVVWAVRRQARQQGRIPSEVDSTRSKQSVKPLQIRRSFFGQRRGYLEMTPSEFEIAMERVLYNDGYRNVRRVGRAGDRGVDLMATARRGKRVVVQCKRYGSGNAVGPATVRELIGTVHNERADSGVLITTSSFSKQAIQEAETARYTIRLIDGVALSRMRS